MSDSIEGLFKDVKAIFGFFDSGQWIKRKATTNVDLNTPLEFRKDPSVCNICIAINKCYFSTDKMPSMQSMLKMGEGTEGEFDMLVNTLGYRPYHMHFRCKCYVCLVPTPTEKQIVATCELRKFTEYVFADGEKSQGKKAMFESWGFGMEDAVALKNEYERQAKETYASANYTLGVLDRHGQRIDIPIEMRSNKHNRFIKFISGWIIYPNKVIRLTTPYGGK